MSKFLKYNDCWWKWNEDNMRLMNFNGGSFPIDENADYWLNGNLVEAKNWHELMHKVGYNPFLADEYDNNVWISPDGECWDAMHTLLRRKAYVGIYTIRKVLTALIWIMNRSLMRKTV